MRRLVPLLLATVFTACASQPTGLTGAEAALERHYRTLPASYFPRAPQGVALPATSTPLQTILVASCLDEEKGPSAALAALTAERSDLFLMIGDNVYGDRDGAAPISNDVDLEELRESFADLAAREDFKTLRRQRAMMVAWDDHDYGANDAGADFPFRRLAERLHERFWGLDTQDAGTRDGTYYARSFGPEGQRTQVIMLDARFFRSKLTPTDQFNAKGKERYLPSADPDQNMLGETQWAWLAGELAKPADVRLIVSSVQVMPTNAHGWEAWLALPKEQDRLYKLIRDTEAKGVVFVSGDRHTAFLYKQNRLLPYDAHEITASSLNVSFAESTTEADRSQVGEGYTKENYGAIDIDWSANTIRLRIKSNTGETVREQSFNFR